MGCCQGQVASVAQAHEKTFAPPQSYPSKLHETAQEDGGPKNAGSDSTTATAPATAWERALLLLTTVVSERERRRPEIWRVSAQSAIDIEDGLASTEGVVPPSRWTEVFQNLHSLPIAEALPRLMELGDRPWQAIWRQLAADHHLAERKLHAELSAHSAAVGDDGVAVFEEVQASDTALSMDAWEDSCQLLKRASMNELTLEHFYRTRVLPRVDGADLLPREGAEQDLNGAKHSSAGNLGDGAGAEGTKGSEPKVPSAFKAALQAKRRMLRLQEQLLWLARVVLTALTSEDLATVLSRLVREEVACETSVDEGLSDIARLWQLAHDGFELLGVYFRTVSDAEEWNIVRAEVRCAQQLCGTSGVPAKARLLIALEGNGLRMVAAPVLAAVPDVGATYDDFCGLDAQLLQSWLRDVCGQSPKSCEWLHEWLQALPNPRNLLTLRAVLSSAAAAISTDSTSMSKRIGGSGPRAHIALCFVAGTDVDAGLTPGRCMTPSVLHARTHREVLEQAARRLDCPVHALHRYEADEQVLPGVCRVFGQLCEVWHNPSDKSSKSLWDWCSDSFVVMITTGFPDCAVATLQWRIDVDIDDGPAEERLGSKGTSANPKHSGTSNGETLQSRLETARESLWQTRFSRHPRMVRSVLRAHGLPAHFACALAEPALLNADPPASGTESAEKQRRAACDEAVGVEMLATAAKHLVREISGWVQERSCPSSILTKRAASQGNGKRPLDSTLHHEGHQGDETPNHLDDDSIGAVENETPVPPIASKDEAGSLATSDSARGRSMPVPCGRSFLEAEAWLVLTALDIREVSQNPVVIAKMKQHLTNHLGLLYVAFWTRLAAAAVELWHAARCAGKREDEMTNNGDGKLERELSAVVLESGQRLLRAACRTPPTLVRAMSSQLATNLRPSYLRNLQLPSLSRVWLEPMLVPDTRLFATASSLNRPEILQASYFIEAAPLSLQSVITDSLHLAGHFFGSFPSAMSACQLLTAGDVNSSWHQPRLPWVSTEAKLEALRLPAGLLENGGPDSPTASSGSLTLLLTRRQAVRDRAGSELIMMQLPVKAAGSEAGKPFFPSADVLALAMCSSQQVQDPHFASHSVQRAKELLRCARWLLLTVMQQACEKESLVVPFKSMADSDKPAIVLEDGGAARAARNCLTRVFRTVQHILQLVVVILGDVVNYPAELIVTLCTLRGYLWEKRGEIDACFFNYLQALSVIDEVWGDPRRQGGRGHPFALFLAWKLGQVSYCRADVRAIDKFADYFRSLLLHYERACPFSWGPPGAPTGPGPVLIDLDHGEISRTLWASEAPLWKESCFLEWWLQVDPLNFTTEGPEPRIQKGQPPHPGLTDWPQGSTKSEGGLTSDIQEVRNGTIFAFGSNQHGQLGVGRPAITPVVDIEKIEDSKGCCFTSRDLWWSCRPVRVMALKDCKVKDIACGESHCLAVDVDGNLFAWGSDARGQIGGARRHVDRAGTGDGIPKAMETYSGYQVPVVLEPAAHLPVRVDPHDIGSMGQVVFTAVACGAEFSMALDRRGDVWAWGSGEGGVLGLGPNSFDGFSAPKRLESFSSPCVRVTCGSYHCTALVSEGHLFSWGRAEGGQLGLSSVVIDEHIEELSLEDTCVCQPIQVAFPDAASPFVQQVACGDVHSMALDIDGQVWSWGWGEFGQLGLGFSSATYEIGVGGMSSKRMTPEPIKREHFGTQGRVKSIACGGAFSGAVREPPQGKWDNSGTLFLWGANEVGQCALPPKKPPEVEVPMIVAALVHTIVASIACGTSHVVCVDSTGKAYSWGASHYGQLGNSTPSRYFSPPPACDKGQGREALLTKHQPTMIQSLSRINIMKAACGLHHSLLVTEVEQAGSESASVRPAGLTSINKDTGSVQRGATADEEQKRAPEVARDTPVTPRDGDADRGERNRRSSNSTVSNMSR